MCPFISWISPKQNHHKSGPVSSFVSILSGLRILVIFFALGLTKVGVNYLLLGLSKLRSMRPPVGVLRNRVQSINGVMAHISSGSSESAESLARVCR